MTITLEIPKELESELAEEAAQLGLSLSEYALRLLSARPIIKAMPKTGAEVITYWKDAGLIGTRRDILDSQQRARKIRAEAEKRAKEEKSYDPGTK
jgi:hypothetical protein